MHGSWPRLPPRGTLQDAGVEPTRSRFPALSGGAPWPFHTLARATCLAKYKHDARASVSAVTTAMANTANNSSSNPLTNSGGIRRAPCPVHTLACATCLYHEYKHDAQVLKLRFSGDVNPKRK